MKSSDTWLLMDFFVKNLVFRVYDDCHTRIHTRACVQKQLPNIWIFYQLYIRYMLFFISDRNSESREAAARNTFKATNTYDIDIERPVFANDRSW